MGSKAKYLGVGWQKYSGVFRGKTIGGMAKYSLRVTWQNILGGGVAKQFGVWVAIFCHATAKEILSLHHKEILPPTPKKFATPPQKFFLPPHCHSLNHNSMSLVQFQHLCLTFLHLDIYLCLPNKSSMCSFTLPDIQRCHRLNSNETENLYSYHIQKSTNIANVS